MKNRHDRAYARDSSIDFKGIAAAALASAKSLLQEWLPGGRFEGHEYVALLPRSGRGGRRFKSRHSDHEQGTKMLAPRLARGWSK